MPFRGKLYYIAPIENIPSIMEDGILCHNLAERVQHHSIALTVVQERREGKRIPQGKFLHDYVNLYFNARNPMLYLRKARYAEICVLEIEATILSLTGVVVSDMNASRDLCKFMSPDEALKKLNFDMIYARYWTHPADPLEEYQHKGLVCAEVLVPGVVHFDRVMKAYVAEDEGADRLLSSGFSKPVTIEPDMFFR